MRQENVLEIRGLSKRIGAKTLVEDVTFDVRPGEIFGLLGPNGAGKTTLMRMIVGLSEASSGDVRIAGLDVKTSFERAMRGVGAIIEGPDMYEDLTGYQNLRVYALLSGGVGEARIRETAERVGLARRLEEKVKTYSLGMRQRLGLAQALLHRPSLLILDEPTNGLDPAGIHELREQLKKLAREENVAVLVSSHLLSEVEKMCDRVAVISRGRLHGIHEMKEIARQEEAVGVTLEVDASHLDAALLVLERHGTSPKVREEADAKVATVALQLTREQIPSLHRALALADVDLYGLTAESASLEDRFLAWTGGGQIA